MPAPPFPTKTIGSLGPVKTNTRAYLRPSSELSADELEQIKDWIIALATEIGALDGSTEGSIWEAIGGAPAWKAPVRLVVQDPGTLSGAFENGDTADGVVLATGDRILLAGQATASQNGIRVVAASGAPARAPDLAAGSSAAGAMVRVLEGTSAGQVWTCTSDLGSDVVDTDDLTWEEWCCAGDVGSAIDTATSNQTGIVANGEKVVVDNDAATPSLRGDVTATWTLGEVANTWLRAFLAPGSAGSPALSVREDATGVYSSAANHVGFSANSGGVEFDAGGATPAFRPIANATHDLGESGLTWRRAFIGTLVAPIIAAAADPVNQAVSLVLSSLTAARTITMPDANVDLQYARAASTTVAGGTETATQTEVNTGTDALRYVTPATLRNLGRRTPIALTSSGVGTYTLSDAAAVTADGFPIRDDFAVDQQDASSDLMAYTIATAAAGSIATVTVRAGQSATFTGSGVTVVPMCRSDFTETQEAVDASSSNDRGVLVRWITATRAELYGGDPSA